MAWSMWPKDTGLGVNMNELISKLFKQSGGIIEIENGNFWTYTTENYDPELFATLIIKECAGLVKKHNYECIRLEEPLYGITSSEILEHFGVEE